MPVAFVERDRLQMEPLSRNHVLTPLLGDAVLVSEICALGPIRPRGKQRLANFHNVETTDFAIALETFSSQCTSGMP